MPGNIAFTKWQEGVRQKTEYRIKQENALKYLMKYFKDSSLTTISKTFEREKIFNHYCVRHYGRYFIEHNVACFFDCSKQMILPRYYIFL